MTNITPDVSTHLSRVAQHFAHELEPIKHLKEITANPVLLGAYAEAAVKRLIHRVVSPMRVSTGAMLDFPSPVDGMRQLDVIVWAPHPVPALFDVEGFGIVPRGSVFGVIEIKRSNYRSSEPSIGEFLRWVDEAFASDRTDRPPYGIAVVPLLTQRPSEEFVGWNEAGRAFAVFQDGPSGLAVRSRDVASLINFLYMITWRYRTEATLEGCLGVATSQVTNPSW